MPPFGLALQAAVSYLFEAIYAAVRFVFHETFQSPLQSLLVHLQAEQTSWRTLPTGGVDVLLQDLRPATQKAYRTALLQFSTWAIGCDVPLDTMRDVDAAVYRYYQTCSRSQAETLLCALIRVYPPLKGNLPWGYARLRTIASYQKPEHHEPLTWYVLTDVAYALVSMGFPRRAGLLVLGWRLGLRPMELVSLVSSDLYGRLRDPTTRLPAFVRLGTGRGTKVNRRQIARAHEWDSIANYLIDLFIATTPVGARLSDIHSYRALVHWLSVGLRASGYTARYSPHCLRSGWATWRFLSGQPILDLMTDGRWKSESSLRVYLDAVSAADSMSDPHMISRTTWIAQLEATMMRWLRW